MRDAVAWVARLSCGHDIGSVPVEYEEPEYQERGNHYRQSYQDPPPAPPAAPPYVYPPEAGTVVPCPHEEGEGRYVVEVVTAVELTRPNLAWHRAGRPASGPATDL